MSWTELLAVMFKEGRRRLLTLAAMFSTVAVVALVVVLLLPKKYEASTLIVIDPNNMIKPLIEGGRPPSSIADQTAIINQIVLGKKVMREMLVFGGWVKPLPARQPDAREEERLIKDLRNHIKIDNIRDEMVRISFTDSDPKRCYQVANKLAEIYIGESVEGKSRDSREAYEFLDKQVKEQGDKLATVHEQVLKQYRGDITPAAATSSDAEPDKPARPTAPKSKISAQELSDLRAEEALLETQIARNKPAQPPKIDTRAEEQLRARVLQLNAELDRLRTTFTDEHPDVKRVQRELTQAKDELSRSEQATAAREAASQMAAQADDDVARAARARLDDVRRRIAAATGTPVRRDSTPRPRPVAATAPETDPEMRTVGRDTTLSELLRRYEATRDIYQDLLKRRDAARFAMEVDAQQRGVAMRVQEPAELPASASGLRLLHLTLIAMLVALAIPIGFLVLLVRFDRRVRSPHQIARLVPLLASISDAPGHRERSRYRSRDFYAALMVGGVFVVYLTVFIIKLKAS